MATGDLNPGVVGDEAAALRGERDALARRCAAAESELHGLRAEVEQLREALRSADSLSLFDGIEPSGRDGDGSDARVLSLILSATALVSALVVLLVLVNGRLFSAFGVLAVALTGALAWGAARTRVVPVEVSVVRGIVYVSQGETTHRFDLRKESTQVEVVGRPGEAGWCVRFHRRHLDPFVVDRSMVEPTEFLARMREFRPEL